MQFLFVLLFSVCHQLFAVIQYLTSMQLYLIERMLKSMDGSWLECRDNWENSIEVIQLQEKLSSKYDPAYEENSQPCHLTVIMSIILLITTTRSSRQSSSITLRIYQNVMTLVKWISRSRLGEFFAFSCFVHAPPTSSDGLTALSKQKTVPWPQ